MKVLENITLYKCEFCKKKLQVKHAMVRHEEFCSKNPKNIKACSMCVFLKETTVEYTKFYFNGYSESEQDVKAKGFKCEKLNKLLYPTKVEKLDLPNRFPETFADQEPMPNKCEHFSLLN